MLHAYILIYHRRFFNTIESSFSPTPLTGSSFFFLGINAPLSQYLSSDTSLPLYDSHDYVHKKVPTHRVFCKTQVVGSVIIWKWYYISSIIALAKGEAHMAQTTIKLYGTNWCSDCKRSNKFLG